MSSTRGVRPAGASGLRLHLLGQMRIESDSGRIDLPTHKAGSLLAYLALHPGPHGRAKLAGLFWGDVVDAAASHSLRTALNSLRRQLGDALILSDHDTLQLNPAFPLWVDALAFARRASDFLAKPSADVQRAGVDLYEGDLLGDVYEDWGVAQREHLHSLYITVLLQIVQELRAQSAYEPAIQFAQRVLAIEPSNERAHQHLMFCFVAMGDRSAALRQYEECRRVLADDLAAEPMPETIALCEWIKGRPAHTSPQEPLLTNLPIPLTSFIGRTQEMAEVKRLLGRHRLVTLTGPGGSGKTRLAIQVASDLMDTYSDGVWFVDLAALQDPSTVPQTVARALGASANSPEEAGHILVSVLRSKRTLLLLDNCEHVAAACAQLVYMIGTAAAGVTILATSRETLAVMGEVAYPVPPLALPPEAGAPSLAALAQFSGTRLFIERAATVSPDLVFSEGDAGPVAAICSQLDGMPLAIELAAARTTVLSVKQIADHLHDRFGLLVSSSRTLPRRQQSLQAAIAWSYDLLSGEEQALLRSLSLFVGGCSLAGAAGVYGRDEPESTVLDLLARLVDKSLVIVEHRGDEARYRMLETIRLYAWERLVEAGEKEAAVRRYIMFYRRLTEAYISSLGPEIEVRFMTTIPQGDRALLTEYANLRAAMAWCRETGDAEDGLWLAGLLMRLFACGAPGDVHELWNWLAPMLSARANVSLLVRSRALMGASLLLGNVLGDYQRALALAEENLALCQAIGDKAMMAHALYGVGDMARGLGKPDVAVPALERSITLFREIGDEVRSLYPLLSLAHVRYRQGAYEQAAALAEEADRRFRQRNALDGTHLSTTMLCLIAVQRKDYARARDLAEECLKLLIFLAAGQRVRDGMTVLAWVAALQGQPERAAILWGCKSPGTWGFMDEACAAMTAVQAQLGDSRYDELVARGQAMTIEQTVDYALERAAPQ